jgi:hypothetical protein
MYNAHYTIISFLANIVLVFRTQIVGIYECNSMNDPRHKCLQEIIFRQDLNTHKFFSQAAIFVTWRVGFNRVPHHWSRASNMTSLGSVPLENGVFDWSPNGSDRSSGIFEIFNFKKMWRVFARLICLCCKCWCGLTLQIINELLDTLVHRLLFQGWYFVIIHLKTLEKKSTGTKQISWCHFVSKLWKNGSEKIYCM